MVDDRPEPTGPLDPNRPRRAPSTIDLPASEVTSATSGPTVSEPADEPKMAPELPEETAAESIADPVSPEEPASQSAKRPSVVLPAATGALLLFGTVQMTMMGFGLWSGERLSARQHAGYLLAFGGLVGLLMPGLAAPPLVAALLMLCAGVAWGIYSLRGKGQGDATGVTAGNFLRALPFALILMLAMREQWSWDAAGAWYALASGALTSGIGYVVWYFVLQSLKATTAATVQLSGPLIVALGGSLFLAEPLTLRWVLACVAILGGIALVILQNKKQAGK